MGIIEQMKQAKAECLEAQKTFYAYRAKVETALKEMDEQVETSRGPEKAPNIQSIQQSTIAFNLKIALGMISAMKSYGQYTASNCERIQKALESQTIRAQPQTFQDHFNNVAKACQDCLDASKKALAAEKAMQEAQRQAAKAARDTTQADTPSNLLSGDREAPNTP